jgi:hypothetical protein
MKIVADSIFALLAGISRDLLAHADLRTTEKHYNRARGIEASRAHSRVIAELKRYSRRH